MSETIDDGGFAFPTPTLFSPDGKFLGEGSDGMSLRDWFAGNALSCLCFSGDPDNWTDDRIAIDAYKLADAMIAARKAGV